MKAPRAKVQIKNVIEFLVLFTFKQEIKRNFYNSLFRLPYSLDISKMDNCSNWYLKVTFKLILNNFRMFPQTWRAFC